jgi:hypothetical protein
MRAAASNSSKASFLRRIRLCWSVVFVLASVPVPGGTLASREVFELGPLPVGVTLPVQLGKTLRAGKTKPGTVFTATTTQRVPVSEESYLDRGATLHGKVVTSTAGDGTAEHPSVIAIRFTELSYRKQTVAIATDALAVASRLAIDDAYWPIRATIDQYTNNPASWTTRQVGGELVARSGWKGPVVDDGHAVGSADYYGVYSLRSETDGMQFPLAVGIFSTTAKGMYGYERETTLESSEGMITITSPKRNSAVVRVGEQMLLEVVGGR